MEDVLFTIPEFANLAGIKKQGIYEQVKNSNSKLFPFVVLKGKKAYIKFEALEKVYGITVKQEQETQGENQEAGNQDRQGESQEPRQDKQGASQEQEQGIIEFLQEQIRSKDRQIEERDKQLTGLLQMLAFERQAHQKTLLELEEAREKLPPEAQEQEQKPIEENKGQEEAPAEEQKDLSWWQKFIKWWRSE